MADSSEQSAASRYVAAYVAQNQRTLTYCRSFFSAVSGSAAGILGFTGLHGFYFYVVTSAIMSGLIWSLKTSGQPTRYFRSAREAVWDGVLGGLFSYVLFWTLLYGIVHVYD
ncbi:Rab5-interacting protein-domain-containing protein [Thamnocephalis sphaerospora]|uniref:ER membrane protein complex subunit 6 n=1 Tax=Thamnocephalis sphaerospora TaxID=78915 RepID=A0A4P9XXP1_9FUNG|nr:Rab5-interacting protein-domain-containing protein [Thamnocephalis sphaerospora]|eukprot:RKP11158.1 Rab5-interacting protein-domain-containing protein [Thamnocephalis sphaerospora]